ncbi:hypothetical protein ACGFNP_34590 [Nonomuraea sp. NPDC049269]|uniref:hypothetical protein n=1 Tax=Nonomuraea sp. NPDC049269 TaxID=3364349 RepID=UPI00371E7F98
MLLKPLMIALGPDQSAHALRYALAEQDIASDIHAGYGLALVSVRVGLVVWCDGNWFWWRVGWNDRRKRVLYARHPADEPVRAARRVAFRCEEVYRHNPHSELIADVVSSVR